MTTTPDRLAQELLDTTPARRRALLARLKDRVDVAEAALERAELALRLRRHFAAARNHPWKARVLVNLALLRHAQDRHAEAIRALEEARVILAAAGDRSRLAAVQANLANSWAQLARFERSRPLY